MNLIVANSILSAGILSLGDFLSQTIERQTKNKEFNVRRLTSMFLFGGIIRGPILFLWYSKCLTYLCPGKGVKVALKKIALDQFAFSPVAIAFFFVIMTLANGGDVHDCERKLRREYWPTLYRSWMLWPSVQLFNFWLIPPRHQIIPANAVAIGWMGYLSYVEFRRKIHHKST